MTKSKKAADRQISVRKRVESLGALAAAAMLPVVLSGKEGGIDKSKPRTSPIPPSAGEFFSVVLLAVLPTTLNTALNLYVNNGETVREALSKALAKAVEARSDQAAAAAYGTLISDSRYASFFEQMLLPENRAAALKISMAAFKAQTVPWGGPPHPRGTDVGALIKTLANYVEKVPA